MKPNPSIKNSTAILSLFLMLTFIVSCGILRPDDNSNGGPDKGHELDDPSDRIDPSDDTTYQHEGGTTYRGHDKGNGGDVVICFKTTKAKEALKTMATTNQSNPFSSPEAWKDVETLSLLDLIEFTLPSGLPPKRKLLLPIDKPYLEALDDVLDRAAPKSGFATAIREELKRMPLNHWKKVGGVFSIDDSKQAFFLPERCLLAQVAVRQDDHVYYDGFIFEKLSERNKLALLLHETIYAISGHSDSVETRKAVGLILSKDEWNELSALDIHNRLSGIGNFSVPTIDGKSSIKFEQQGNELKGHFSSPTLYDFGKFKTLVHSATASTKEQFLDGKFTSLAGQLIEPINSAEHVLSIQLDTEQKIVSFKKWTDNSVSLTYKDITIALFSSASLEHDHIRISGESAHESIYGKIRSDAMTIDLTANQVQWTHIKSQIIEDEKSQLCVHGTAKFDSSGQLAYISNVSLYQWSCQNNHDDKSFIQLANAKYMLNNTQVWFYPNGDFKKIERNESASVRLFIEENTELYRFEDVSEAVIRPDQTLERVTLGNFGKYKHKNATADEWQEAKNQTFVIGENGDIQ